MSVLLTGASGFVGAGVLGTLRERGVAVRPVVRAASSTAHMEDAVVVSDLRMPGLDGRQLLSRVQAIALWNV